jgi:hypothetical protein
MPTKSTPKASIAIVRIQKPMPNCTAIEQPLTSKSVNAQFNAENYGKVIEDCKMALKYKPDYVKAFFRYANALKCLKRYK